MSELTPNLKLFKYDPVADAKQPLDIQKAWNDNWDILDKNTGGVPIGMIYPALLGIDESENKYRYLNGQIIIQDQFINFTKWLKDRLTTAPSMFTTEQNWQAEKTASKLGQCGKFVVDDTAGTIRLPLVININGLTDLANCGVLKDESLPNITGTTGWILGGAQETSGAFSISKRGGYGGGTGECNTTTFDASRSSSTYQDSAPVQQEAIQYPYVIVVNTGVEEAERPINNYQVNNVYSYGMSQYYKGTMNNSSWLRSAGQWNSGTVYTGLYNWAVAQQAAGVDGFKLSTEEYSDYDFVVNTEEQTFRLPIKNGQEGVFADKVKGNGIALGYTNGTQNFGVTAFYGANGASNTGNYGKKVGDTTAGSTNINDTLVSGLTPDSSKSGIVVDLTVPDGYNLYYYVGDTLQNTGLINIARIGEEVVDIKSTPHVVEVYVNGASGYRIWTADNTGLRYCEQWGKLNVANKLAHVTFLKKFKDINYNISLTASWAETATGQNEGVKGSTLSTTGMDCTASYNSVTLWWKVSGYIIN